MSILTKLLIGAAIAASMSAQASASEETTLDKPQETVWKLVVPDKKITQEQPIKLSKKLYLVRTDQYVVSVEPNVLKDVYTHLYVKRKSEKFLCLTFKMAY